MKSKLFRGFTLTELIITIGILTTLFAIIAISLSYVDQKTTSGTKAPVIASELRSLQLQAMTGDAGASGTTADQGIYFQQNQYTIFRGSTYDSSNITNQVFPLPNNLRFSTIALPASQIIFEKSSGIVSNYNAANNYVVLQNTTNSETIRLTVNQLGTVTSVN